MENQNPMKRFVSAFVAVLITIWNVTPVPAAEQELRTEGPASDEVRAGLEQRLLGVGQPAAEPAAAGLENGPTVQDVALAIGDEAKANQWIQQAVGTLPDWSRETNPPQSWSAVLRWAVPERWPQAGQVRALLAEEPPVMVLGGGHGTRQILRSLGETGIVAIGGSNVLDYGGRSATLYQELEKKRGVRPVMMGDDMNLRADGLLHQILQMKLPPINPKQPLWPQVAAQSVFKAYDGAGSPVSIVGIPNLIARWESQTGLTPKDRAALIRLISFAYLVFHTVERDLVQEDSIEIGGQSFQNILHVGTMVMVGAYPRRGPISEGQYLVGLHLLGEATGGTRWVLPSSFQRPDLVTVHGDLRSGVAHATVYRGINTVTRVLKPDVETSAEDRAYLERYVRGPNGEKLTADQAIQLMREMLADSKKAPVLVRPGAYRHDRETYREETGENFRINPYFRDQIRRAEMIVLAPGNFHESVLSVLSVPGVLTELAAARKRGAEVIWILNPVNLPFTSGYTAGDYARVLEILLREETGDPSVSLDRVLSRVLLNRPPEDPDSELARVMRGESFAALAESDDPAKAAAYLEVAHQHSSGPVELGDLQAAFASVPTQNLDLAQILARPVRGVAIAQAVYGSKAISLVDWAEVRSAMRELLGIDPVQGQRWPAGVPEMVGLTPEGILGRFTQTWTARMKRDGVDLKNPQAVRAYLNREAIPWRIILAGGRGRRVSPASLIRKPLVRADGVSTALQQGREAIRWGGMPDVVVVDAAIAYQLLRERVEVPEADREVLAGRLAELLTRISEDFDQMIQLYGKEWNEKRKKEYLSAVEQILALRQPVANLVRGGWRLSADSRQQGDVAQMLRQLQGILSRRLTGEPLKWVDYIWDVLADGALRYLVEDPQNRFMDPKSVADVLGGRAIVIMGVPEGTGGSLKVAIQRLKEMGRLQEHAYIMPVYSDYAAASLPWMPNPYLIGLLAGLSNPDDPNLLPRVVIGAKAPRNSLPVDKGNVVFLDPAHPEKGARAIREWRDMSPEEQTRALEGFGKSLRQQGIARELIPQVEGWDKLGETMQRKVYEGYDTHTPGVQPFYHAFNAGIFIFETKLVEGLMAEGIWTPYGSYDYPDPDKAKLHEFWYTTVVEVAAEKGEQVRVVPLGPDSPGGLKDTARIVKYGAQRQQMVTDRLKEMGVNMAPDAVVTVSSSTGQFDPDVDLPRMFPAPHRVEIKGRVHLETSVRVGVLGWNLLRAFGRTLLDGTERPVILQGNAVVNIGTTLQPSVTWLVGSQVPAGAVPLTPEEVRFLRSKLGVAVTEGARIYLLPQQGWDLAQGEVRRQALAQIFEARPDQVWLEGEVVLEPSVRIQSGTWLNGRHRPVILRGRTLIGQGRSVAASELSDTALAPLSVLDAFNYRPPRLGREVDVFNAVLQGQRIEAGEWVRDGKQVSSLLTAGLEAWYKAGREQVEVLRGEAGPGARVLFSPIWDEPVFSGWLGTGLQVRGRIQVNIESDRLLVWRLEGEGPAAGRVGRPVTLFQAEPGQAVVVPPGTVLDERVFDPAVALSMAQSPFRSENQEEILFNLFHQQSKVGALVEPEAGLPEPKTFPDVPYQLTLRPGRAKSIAVPIIPTAERPCPLCSAQWEDNEGGYRRGAYIPKPNKYPAHEGDTVWIALRHQPQNFLGGMLRDMVVNAGGSYDDPVAREADWLIRNLLERKERGDPNIRGINVVVVGPGLYRTFYNDFDHSSSTSHGASIWEHAHYQGTPYPQPIEKAGFDPIASVDQVTFHWVRDWDAPAFAVRSAQVTVYVYSKLRHDVTPPLPPDRQAYLQMDKAGRDQTPWVLINPAALDMSGNFITSDQSTFERATLQHLRQLLLGSATPREALAPIVEAIRLRAAAGLEEKEPTVAPRPRVGAEYFAQQGGTDRSAFELAAQGYVKQAEVPEAVERAGGELVLDAAAASLLAGRPALGGVLVRTGRPAAPEQANFLIWADSDLPVPEELKGRTVFVGHHWADLLGQIPATGQGDLILVEKGADGVTASEVETALASVFPTGRTARAVLATPAEMTVVSAAGLEALRIRSDLPRVVVLNVAAGLESESGATYTLILAM